MGLQSIWCSVSGCMGGGVMIINILGVIDIIDARIDDLEQVIIETERLLEKEPEYKPDPMAYGIIKGRLAELSYLRAKLKGDNK